MITIKISCI